VKSASGPFSEVEIIQKRGTTTTAAPRVSRK